MSKNKIIILIYHRHKLLDLKGVLVLFAFAARVKAPVFLEKTAKQSTRLWYDLRTEGENCLQVSDVDARGKFLFFLRMRFIFGLQTGCMNAWKSLQLSATCQVKTLNSI
jgi:hypothetical protein